MKRATIACMTAALCGAVLFAGGVVAQDADRPDPKAMVEMQKKMIESAQPGPEHALLASLAGEWTATATMWPMPGADPLISEGEAVNTMVLGGRWLQSTTTATMHGGTTESFSMLGFDRRHEQFVTVGFDNMGTYFVTAAGKQDPESGAIVMSGTDEDPIFNMTQVYDIVVEIVDEDHFTTSIIFRNPEMTQGAESFKMAEMKYTRKQEDGQ